MKHFFLTIGLICTLIISISPNVGYADNKIVGGVEAQVGAWPWIAALIDSSCSEGESYYNYQFCGGALIHKNWIITAAHCVTDDYGSPKSPTELDAVLNIHDLENDRGERINIKRVIVHPSYTPATYDYDLALLELETASSQQTVSVVSAGAAIEGIDATVIGWGNMSGDENTNSFPNKLQQVTVPVITNSVCNEAYGSGIYGYDIITDNMFCAGLSAGGKDSCQGDSGGPIVQKSGSAWKQIGVVSWGTGCAQPGYYGVYTRLSEFSSFISQYVVASTTLEVTSTSPVANETNVSIGTQITATFSADINEDTISDDSFQVSDGTNLVAGQLSYSNRVITFTPSALLTVNTIYTVTMSTSIIGSADETLESAYTWSFTTSELSSDTTKPNVVIAFPENGSTDIPTSTLITATFSDELDPNSITSLIMAVTADGDSIAGVVTYKDKVLTFTPDAHLNEGATILVTIGSSIKDLAGNTMAEDYEWSFTTATGVDTTSPTVSQVSPSNNAIDVSVETTIQVTFSEAIDPSSVTETSFIVQAGTTPVTGELSVAGDTVLFKPTNELDISTQYTVTLATDIKDTSGNALAANYEWGFTTSNTGPTVPPVINAIFPAKDATDVSVLSTITAEFSKNLNESSIASSLFYVQDGVTYIQGTISYSNKTISFKPTNRLKDNTTYQVFVSNKIKDEYGLTMDSEYSWSFTTQATSDKTPPAIASVYPTNGTLDISVNSKITITFSEDLTEESVNKTTFLLQKGTQATKADDLVSGTVSYENKVATFTPSAALDRNTIYYSRITSGIKDLYGNFITGDYTWRFTTVKDLNYGPFIVNTANPPNNSTGVILTSRIIATFSHDIDPSSIDKTTFTVNDTVQNIDGSFSTSGTNTVFIPVSNLEPSTIYTVTLSAKVKDTNGAELGADYQWSFQTIASSGDGQITATSTSTDNSSNSDSDNDSSTCFIESIK